ncbi:MAG TPA: SRPBCC family protein [Xanthobacteraceae bacterium]|nr:SRPBCC family protein [Xanthobacteraceae bacterium]
MRRVVLVIVALFALTLGGVVALASIQPDEFRVTRTVRINATPDRVYPLINDLRGWQSWSPYEKKDPAMKRTFGNVTAGKGASYEWDGDSNVGKGRMEIAETVPPSKVVIDLHFMKPFEGRSTAEFLISQNGPPTDVTWTMHGPAQFITKIMCVFFDMDKMIGPDFEVGLANLKTIAEK